MSKTIDERVVSMEFDNQKFEKNIEKTITSLENLDDTINEFGSKGGDSFLDLSDGLSRMEVVFAGFYEKIGGYLGDLAIKGFEFVKSMSFDQVAEGFNKYTAETKSAQAIVSNTGATIEETYAAIDRVAKYTDETSYDFSNLTKTMTQFAMAGIDLEDAEVAVKGIGNWAALSGAGINEANIAMNALSKSISSGQLSLREWDIVSRSASMGTANFVDELIATARESSAAFREFEALNGEVNFKNFRLTAFGNNKLISSDILLETLRKYGDEEGDLGKEAKAAAKEAKTLAEAINAVKDAVSGNWRLAFRYLFGDYKEARKFWTFVQDAMIDVFTLGQDFIVKVLKKWHGLEEGGWADMFEALQHLWEGVKNLAAPIGEAFQNVFNFDANKTVENLSNLTSKFKEASESFDLLTGAWKNRDALDEYLDKLSKKKVSIAGPSIIDEKVEKLLYDDIGTIEKSEALYSKIKTTFEGLFSIVDLAKMAISGFATGLKNSLQFVKPLGSLLLEISSSIGSFVTKLSSAVKNAGLFEKVFGSIGNLIGGTLKAAIETVTKIFGKLFKRVDSDDSFTKLESVLTSVGNAFEWISENILNKLIIPAFDGLASAVSSVIDFLTPLYSLVSGKVSEAFTSIQKFFSKTDEGISPFKEKFDKTKESMATFFNEFKEKKLTPLKESFTNAFGKVSETLGEFKDKLKAAFQKDEETDRSVEEKVTLFEKLVGIFQTIYDKVSEYLLVAFDWIAEKAENLKGNLDPLVTVFDNVRESVKNFFDQFKKGEEEGSITLFERVGDVITGVLDVILGVIGKVVDWIKANFSGKDVSGVLDVILDLLKGLVAIKVAQLVGNLSDIAGGIAGLTDRFKEAKKAANNIKDIAISLLLLAASVKMLSTVSASDLEKSLKAITELITELMAGYAVMNTMSVTGIGANATMGNNVQILSPYVNFTSKMIDLAAGVYILVAALQKVGKLPMDEIEKGLTALAGVFLSLGAFAKLAQGSELVRHSKSFKGFAQGVGTVLLDLAAAGIILSLAIKMLSTIEDPSKLLGSLAAISTVIVFLAGFTKAVNNTDTTKAASSLVALSASVLIIAASLAILTGVKDVGKLAITGGIIAALIIALGASIRIMGDSGTLAGAAGIIIIAAALAVLTPVIAVLGSLPFDQVGQGLLAIVVALTAFAITGAIMKTAGDGLIKFGEALLMISGSVALLGVGLVALAAGIAAMGGIVLLFGDSLIKAFGELLPSIVDAILNGILYLLSQVLLAAPLFGALGVAIIVAIGESISLQLDALLATAIALLISFINSLATTIEENKEALSDAVANLLLALIHLVADFITNIFNRIFEFFGMTKVDTGNWFTDLLGIVVQGIAGLLYAIVQGIARIIMFIGEKIVLIPLLLLKMFLEAVGINTEWLDKIIDGVKNFFKNVWENTIKALTEIWDKVTGWFKNLWGKIKGIFKGKDKDTGDLAEDAKEGMDRVTDAMGDSIEEGGKEVEEKALGLSEDAVDAFDQSGKAEEEVEEKAEDLVESFSMPFDLNSDGAKSLLGDVGDLVGGVTNGFSLNGQGEKEAFGIGEMFSTGYKDGILSKLQDVWNASTQIGTTSKNALRQTLDEHSPSKIARRIGDFFGKGFALGINDGSEEAITSAEDMGNGAISILKEALSGFDDLDTDNIENPVIKPVLDLSEIQNGQASISDILSGRYPVGLSDSLGAVGRVSNNRSSSGSTENIAINMTINGAAGQSVDDLANAVVRRINQSLKSRERVWA